MGNKNNYSLKMPEKQRKVKLLLKDHNLLKRCLCKGYWYLLKGTLKVNWNCGKINEDLICELAERISQGLIWFIKRYAKIQWRLSISIIFSKIKTKMNTKKNSK